MLFCVLGAKGTAFAGQTATPPSDAQSAAPSPSHPDTDTLNADHEDVGHANSDVPDHGHTGTRIFGVLPNYATVEGATAIERVSSAQKFKMAAMNSFDPYLYPFVGVMASLNETYGGGTAGFLKQYAASFTDNSVGNFMTSAVLPSVLHQDPRYFARGRGSVSSRAIYAASRILVTRGDAGARQLNMSELAGNAFAATLSNAYYPSAERTMSATLTRWGTQLMWDALSNELKEFWPDVRRKLHGQ
jgi:hypothetical protein